MKSTCAIAVGYELGGVDWNQIMLSPSKSLSKMHSGLKEFLSHKNNTVDLPHEDICLIRARIKSR